MSKALANHSTAIRKQMDQLTERVDELRNKDVEETSALDLLTQQVQASTTAMAQLFADWEEDLKRHCATLTEQLGLDCELHVTNVSTSSAVPRLRRSLTHLCDRQRRPSSLSLSSSAPYSMIRNSSSSQRRMQWRR